jgi:hypothetical protein
MTNLSNTYVQSIQKEAYFVYNSAGICGSTDYDVRVNPNLAHRVPENKICTLANNRLWESGYNFTPYDGTNATNSYFLNTINNVVYLLLSKGPNGRKDEWSQYLSTVLPTHENGIASTSDYHTWFAYYKVPENKLDFIDTQNLPVPLTFFPKDNYTTFTEKYEINCTEGVTTFGCCCLYYNNYDQDEISGEVYNVGDVTNQTIFSQCYECQQLAELMNKEFIFLSGKTVGDITSAVTDENPLCPATKAVNNLQTILNDELLPSNSYLYFQRNLINTFENNSGIASITLDFTGKNPDDYKMDKENPVLYIIDPLGSGAEAKIKTFKKIINGIVYHIPYGIDLISRGKNYVFPDISIEGTSTSHPSYPIYELINVVHFADDFLTNVSKLIVPQRTAYENTITSTDLIEYFNGSSVASISLLLQPTNKELAPAKYVPNNSSIIPLVDTVYLGSNEVEDTGAVADLIADPTTVIYDDLRTTYNSSNNNYAVYLSHLATRPDGSIKWRDDSGAYVTVSNGWRAALTDVSGSVAVGDIINLPDAIDSNTNTDYSVRRIERAQINKISGQIVSTVNLSTPINLQTEASQTVKHRTFRITINTNT